MIENGSDSLKHSERLSTEDRIQKKEFGGKDNDRCDE